MSLLAQLELGDFWIRILIEDVQNQLKLEHVYWSPFSQCCFPGLFYWGVVSFKTCSVSV